MAALIAIQAGSLLLAAGRRYRSRAVETRRLGQRGRSEGTRGCAVRRFCGPVCQALFFERRAAAAMRMKGPQAAG